MPAKNKKNEKAKKAKSIFRPVVQGDADGTIDSDLLDDSGMKQVQVRNANKGLIFTRYDKDNKPMTAFISVKDLIAVLAKA